MEDTVSSIVKLECQPMCCAISPTSNVLATGLIDGSLLLYSFTLTVGGDKTGSSLTHSLAASPKVHQADQSCRAVAFSHDGAILFSGSADKSICVSDTATGKPVFRLADAHGAELSALGMMGESGLLASGDEDGQFKLWDVRTKENVFKYKKHTDYISCIVHHPQQQYAVVASGDGTLSLQDLRQRKVRLRTEDDADDEILSVAVMKNGKKLVTGTQSGVINIYSWGQMKDCSDRFPGHPESVDAIVKFDESTVLTGSSDGAIRIVSVLPNKLLGILGSHDNFPVESMAISSDQRVLSSTSHDNTVRLWDLSILQEDDEDEDEGGDDEDGAEGGEGEQAVDKEGEGEEEEMDSLGEDESDLDEDEDEEEDEDEDQYEGKEEDGEPCSQPHADRDDNREEEDDDENEEGGKANGGRCKEDDDDSDDDDSDDDGPKKKKAKKETTKWRKGSELQRLKQEAAQLFFKDLL